MVRGERTKESRNSFIRAGVGERANWERTVPDFPLVRSIFQSLNDRDHKGSLEKNKFSFEFGSTLRGSCTRESHLAFLSF